MLGVLAELGVADELAEKPLTVDEIAERVGAQPKALHRVLRAAASIGVFAEAEDGDGRFGLTPIAELLQNRPGSLREATMMFACEPFWSPYAQIAHTVRTGEPAFDQVYNQSIYEYLPKHPEQSAIFGAAVAAFHGRAAPVLIVETMIPAGNEPHYSKFDDIEMMVIAGGFRPGRVVRCDDRFSMLEAE